MTVSDTHEPDASAGTAGVATPCAGTAAVVLAVAPESDVAVMSAVTGRAGRVGQHQETRRHAPGRGLARAVPGGGLRVRRTDQRTGRRRGGDGRRRAPHGHGDPDPRDHQHDECGHAPPALATAVGRHQNVTVSMSVALSVTTGSGDATAEGVDCAAAPADQRQCQQHPGGQLQDDHERNEGELREREGGPALGAGRVLRRPAERRLPRHRVPVQRQGEAPRRGIAGVEGARRQRAGGRPTRRQRSSAPAASPRRPSRSGRPARAPAVRRRGWR